MNFGFKEILNWRILGNSLFDYSIALFIFGAILLVLRFFKSVVISKIQKAAKETKTKFDDLIIEFINSISWFFYVFLALYISLKFIKLSQGLEKVLFYALIIIFAYYITKGFQALIDYGLKEVIKKKIAEDKGFDPSLIDFLAKILKGVLWGVAVIVVLQNLGYNVTALVAGLGIGGIAVAFALQNILADIFSSFSIYLDKPFQTGDFIVVGDKMGTVKKIGIKSTRIQTLQGEELVISNKELTETQVHNYKRMEKRRAVFSLGVIYETPTEKLKRVPQIIKEIIEKVELAEIDRVHFKEFGDFSLNFEVVYYVKSSSYYDYMDTQQEINFAIKERFEKEGIEMAYPTQTIFLNTPEKSKEEEQN